MHVLQICPFPIPNEPNSGGTIRISEIRKAYEAAGHTVTQCCVVTKKRDKSNNTDVSLGIWDRIRRKHFGHPHNIGQIRIYWASKGNARSYASYIAKNVDAPVDVIQVEHPWTIDIATELKNFKNFKNARTIYSSHNIEHRLHAGLWELGARTLKSAERMTAEIEKLEIQCAVNADVCWAVSESDKAQLEQWGAKSVVLAPNGCRALMDRTRGDLERSIETIDPYALFIGGDYAPNTNGFMEKIVRPMLRGTATPRILVAGSVCNALERDTSLQPLISKKSVILRGVVSRRELDDLIHFSHALLLPISSGGGTNLKTAEAIVSNKTVICTTTALRGFENWAAAPGIYIEDENDAFARRAAETLKDSKIPKNWHRDSSSVTWPYTLNAAILSAERLAPMNRETDVTQ